MMAMADGSTTVVRIQADEQDLETKYYTLQSAVKMLPKAAKLAQLYNIEMRLSLLRSEIIVGGAEKVDFYLKFANEQLAEKYPQAKALTAADLHGAYVQRENLNMSFYRQVQSGGLTATVSVQVKAPTNGEATAQVYAGETPIK